MLTLQTLTTSEQDHIDSNKGLLLNALQSDVLNEKDAQIVREMQKNGFRISAGTKHYGFSYNEDQEIEERCAVQSDRICHENHLYYSYY